MSQKVFKSGNSLAVVVPAGFTHALGVKASDDVQVEAEPDKGRVIYKFSGALQLPLSGEIMRGLRKKRKSS